MQMTYVVPKIAFPARLAAFGGFAALGFAAQILLPGGGGFILFLSDSVDTAFRLRNRLSAIEHDRARVVDMRINEFGLHVTVS